MTAACRYLLSQHPEAQAKVAEELDSLEVLATPERPNPRALEYADMAKLPYLQAAIKARPPQHSEGRWHHL